MEVDPVVEVEVVVLAVEAFSALRCREPVLEPGEVWGSA